MTNNVNSATDDEFMSAVNRVITVSPVEDIANILSKWDETLMKMGLESDVEVRDFVSTVLHGDIPDSIPFAVSREHSYEDYGSIQAHLMHKVLMEKAAYFTRVTKSLASSIADFVGNGTVLIPMAGRGFLAKSLQEAGVKVIATDNNSFGVSIPKDDMENAASVGNGFVSSSGIGIMDAMDALDFYGDHVTHLVMAWVTGGSDLDLRLLRRVRECFLHITVINIGEGRGGCTGSDEFWDEVDIVDHEDSHYWYETTSQLRDMLTIVK